MSSEKRQRITTQYRRNKMREYLTRKIYGGVVFALAIFGTTILAVSISGTIKTWTTGEVLKSADLNTTIASLQTAIQNIPNWTKSGGNTYFTDGYVGIGTTSMPRILTVITGTTRHNLSGGALFTSALSATTGGVLLGSDNNIGYISGVDGLGTTVGNLVLNQNGGNVGIGTAGPTAALTVTGNTVMAGYSNGQLHLTGTNGNQRMVLGYDTTNDYGFIQPVNISSGYKNLILNSIGGNVGIGIANPSVKLEVGASGDGSVAKANAWNTFSDERLKTNFEIVSFPLEKISKLSGYYYFWKNGIDKKKQLGIKAGEVEKVLPEIVSTSGDGYRSVDYSKMAALFIEAIKELAFRLRSTSDSVSVVTQKIDSLEKEKAANEKKLLALEESNQKLVEDNKRLREDMARLRGTLEDRLRAIENTQMARK